MKLKAKQREIDMTQGPLLGKVLVFSLPLMFSGVLQLLYNAADVVVVGRFAGNNSLAAVGSTTSLLHLIINLFIGLSVGTSVTVANSLGAKDYAETHKSVHTAILLSLITGAAGGAFGYCFARRFLIWMGTPEQVLPLSTVYLKIYFCGLPGLMFYNFGAAILSAMGDTVRPLRFLSISGLINLLLNLFFVIVLKMDVAGVALATVISQYVSALFVLICLLKLENACCLRIKGLRIYKESLKKIVRIGMPAGLQSAMFSVSNVLLQSSINDFGATVMAANAASTNVEGFTYTVMNAVSQAALTFTSQNVGAKKYERIKKVLLVTLLTVTVVGLMLGSGSYFGGRFLLKLFTKDSSIIPYGLTRLKYVALPYFLCGVMEVFVGSLRGMKCSTPPMIVTLFGTCVFRIIWIFFIFPLDPVLENLYIIYPVSWIITGFVHFISVLIVKKKYKVTEYH